MNWLNGGQKERGHAITLDEDYAADVEQIVWNEGRGPRLRRIDCRYQHVSNRQAGPRWVGPWLLSRNFYAVTIGIALLAGRISGDQGRRGITMPFADLLIGATALLHRCEVVTENVRHFEMMSGIVVKKLWVRRDLRVPDPLPHNQLLAAELL